MDKKSKIIMIICIIIIVIGIGIATSIAIIKNKTEKVKINKDEKDTTPEYDPSKEVNEMTDDELENLL